MRLRWHRLASLGVLCAAVLAAGCKPPPSKVRFNNGISEANNKLGQKAAVYRKALFPQGGKDVEPDKVDRDALRTAWSDMDKTLRDIKDKYLDSDFQLPRRSAPAAALKTAYDDYLDGQTKILDMAQEINNTLADSNLGIAEKKRTVEGLLEKIKDTENETIKKVLDAQKSLCETHNFKLVSKLD